MAENVVDKIIVSNNHTSYVFVLKENNKIWNQEVDRATVSANVDERTRFELYYQPFIGAIEAECGKKTF
jgi:hypothetical protein